MESMELFWAADREHAKIAVAQGEQWMDEVAPADWRDQINLRKLNIQDAENCVLGQVFGGVTGFITGCGKLVAEKGEKTSFSDYGFSGDGSGYMKEEWKRVITEKRALVTV